ncbi:hypothetical protein BBO99_00000509 [Phytophthora kernoviae]|uniref:ELMO domain-containing protein n=2 Tax=Phytophthora kernoviae TaxID=325452 RepID=A0A3R7K6A3_9STRA|nr:hypothetical protein G195_001505 [Phytophthora kernoviae 00238/432]KAG2532096.1 hypothetical protein JM16_000554 [Phytophthora kernoviae]KAG2533204.1 hypothetical protein JM18_000635 [Phytophthora kernoviae]RLN26035.1 hypothetical protein BBI17_000548 [Phytophthora kernoviae]RLN85482.1 hypothetical protein BBO99_00000509 [Phytophthora kernoviae]
MGNANGRELSQAERGRRPTDKEMLVLFKMQRALFRRLVASPEHLQLLQRYWTASFRRKPQMPAFVLVSDLWLEAGFADPNPAADLNPTGELGLQCLVFFVETYPAETAMMRRGRGGYPFAQAAVAILRSLCLTLHLMDATHNPGPFPVTAALFWKLFERDVGFYQLFALAFLTFEEHFCEEVACNPWMRDAEVCSITVVDKLVAAVELRLTNALKRAPIKLADIQDLCSNGRHIVEKTDESCADMLGSSGLSANGSDQSSVSRWSQHHTSGRKNIRQVGRSWGKENQKETQKQQKKTTDASSSGGYRLRPRMPEIKRPSSDSSQASGASSDADSPRYSRTLKREDLEDAVDEEEDAGSPDQAAAEPTEDLFAGLVTKTMTSLASSMRKEHNEVPVHLPLARSC